MVCARSESAAEAEPEQATEKELELELSLTAPKNENLAPKRNAKENPRTNLKGQPITFKAPF